MRIAFFSTVCAFLAKQAGDEHTRDKVRPKVEDTSLFPLMHSGDLEHNTDWPMQCVSTNEEHIDDLSAAIADRMAVLSKGLLDKLRRALDELEVWSFCVV